eukprot:scaffold40497_cov22-Tisochrysis_lutea.AAC.4
MGACPQVVAYSSPLLLGKVVLFDYRTATATNSVCIPQQSATHWLGILPCLVAKHTCCLWGAGSLGRSTALGELPSWCGSNTTNHGTSAAYHLHSHHAVQPGNLLTFSERKGNAAYEVWPSLNELRNRNEIWIRNELRMRRNACPKAEVCSMSFAPDAQMLALGGVGHS